MSNRERIDTGVWTKPAKRRAWVCGVGAALVVASVIVLPARRFVHHPGGQRSLVWHEEGYWHCALYSTGAYEAALDDLRDRGLTFHSCDVRHAPRQLGVWAPTLDAPWAQMTVDDRLPGDPRGPAPDVMLAARTAMDAEMRSSLGYDVESEFPGILATGEWQAAKVLWLGWFINVCTAAGVLFFAWSVPGVVRDIRRHDRMMRLMSESRCGWCGYDVRGLAEGQRVCPECGKALREGRIA